MCCQDSADELLESPLIREVLSRQRRRLYSPAWLQFFTRRSFGHHIPALSLKEGGARAMKKIISLASVGVLSLALAAPVLADNQHDGRVRGPHVQSARFEHFRSFRGPFVQTYYYPYPYYVYYPYPVYYPEAVAQESPWDDPAPEVQREVVFSTGKYVLQSDGGDSYRWIWIPAVPEAP